MKTKTKIANNLLRLGLIAAAAAIIPSASASVLIAGFDSFVGSTANKGPEAAVTSFSGTGFLSGNPASSSGTFGGPSGPAAGIDNGRYSLSTAAGTSLSPLTVTLNGSGDEYKLQSIVFDARVRNTNSGQVNVGVPSVDYTYTATINGSTVASGTGTVSDTSYSAFSIDLFGYTLLPTDILAFTIAQVAGPAGGIVLDNVGLLAVPEPSGVMALGMLVGSGAFLRNRRRRTLA